MSLLSQTVQAYKQMRKLLIVFLAGVLVITATACSQADTTAISPSQAQNRQADAAQPVTEATEAAIERAQGNLSDQAVDEDVLSKQGTSRARQSGGTATP